MKKGYRIFTAFCIMGILIMSAGSAMAAYSNWTTTNSAINVITGGNTGLLYAIPTAAYTTGYSLGAAESLSTGDFVSITLTGGAVFSSTPITAATTTAGALNRMTGSGDAGSTVVQFRASMPIASPSAITFTMTGGFNVTNVPAGANVDFLLTITSAAGTVLTSNASIKNSSAGGAYPFVGVNLLTVTNTPLTATPDVMSVPAYTKFLNSQLNGGAGSIQLATGFVTGSSYPTSGLSAKKCLVTLVGDFTGITKVTTAGFTGCDSTGSTAAGTAGQFLINAAKTEAYATNAADFAAVTLTPNFYVDGTTVQATRTFTAKVENFVDGGNYLANTWMSPTITYRLTRNGTFFSANSLGALNNIKISDLSGNVPTGGAKVLINAWDAAGVRLAEASGNADILVQNNSTVIISGAEFAARFVGTPMKYEVAVQSVYGTVSNIKKDPVTGGITSSVWTNSGGGAL